MKKWKAIAAMSENRVIGVDNKIPWHIPEDFKWFKKTTMGHIMIMGRKTFESIGKPLPGRETVVVSRSGFEYPGIKTITDLEEIDSLDTDSRDIYICGGAEIYKQTMERCSDLYLTIVKRKVDGDAFFPDFENNFSKKDVIVDTDEYQILHFVKA